MPRVACCKLARKSLSCTTGPLCRNCCRAAVSAHAICPIPSKRMCTTSRRARPGTASLHIGSALTFGCATDKRRVRGKSRGDVLRVSVVSVQFSRPTCSARQSFPVDWGWQSLEQCARLQTFGSRCPTTMVAERLLQLTTLACGPGAARHFGLHFIGLRARRGAPHCYGLAGSTVAERRLI